MTDCPEIVTYWTDAPGVPDGMRAAAAMIPSTRLIKGKPEIVPGSSWMATAKTEEEARAKLEALWLKQYPPEDKRRGPRKRVEQAVDSDFDVL